MNSRRKVYLAAVSIGLVACATPAPLKAQGLLTGGGEGPVSITADQGIEWLRNERKYVARGNASASRDGATITADTLTAYYREQTEGGSQDIFRVDADGHVRISTRDQQAVGDKGVYHADEGVFVLTGKNLRLTSSEGVLTARDSLEYWERLQLAVARGDAVVLHENERIRADVMTAHLTDESSAPSGTDPPPTKTADPQPATAAKPGAAGSAGPLGDNSRIQRIDALGNVQVSLQDAIVYGDNGVYVPATNIATICGNVKITSGDNQLNGECAEVNLRNGIYRLTGRAEGLLQPNREPR